MSINYNFYGTEAAADEYFDNRLYSCAWECSPSDRKKALIQATWIIDTLRYQGVKSSIYALLPQDQCDCINDSKGTCEPKIDRSLIKQANEDQPNEFPRNGCEDVPCEIEQATYEIAYALVDGKCPELELESIGISSQAIESVRTTYARNQVPIEHIINMVPSAMAWRLIRPWLHDEDCFYIDRV